MHVDTVQGRVSSGLSQLRAFSWIALRMQIGKTCMGVRPCVHILPSQYCICSSRSWVNIEASVCSLCGHVVMNLYASGKAGMHQDRRPAWHK